MSRITSGTAVWRMPIRQVSCPKSPWKKYSVHCLQRLFILLLQCPPLLLFLILQSPVQSPASPLIVGHNWLNRTKRDETENNRGAYGRGIAFYVGEPCEDQCNRILFHVFCNLTSHECACLPEYPVNVDNTICAQALHLGETCEHDASCRFYDKNSFCEPEERKCRCDQHHYPKVDPVHGPVCVKGKGIYAITANYELLTAISAISSLIFFLLLLFILYRFYNKSSRLDRSFDRLPSQFNGHAVTGTQIGAGHIAGTRTESISPFLLLGEPLPPALSCTPLSSRRNSADSLSELAPPPPPFRSASYSMLAPPTGTQFLSRRPSMSSLQSSFRSCSSLPSQSSNRPNRAQSATIQALQGRPFDINQAQSSKRRYQLIRSAHVADEGSDEKSAQPSPAHLAYSAYRGTSAYGAGLYHPAYEHQFDQMPHHVSHYQGPFLSRSANSIMPAPYGITAYGQQHPLSTHTHDIHQRAVPQHVQLHHHPHHEHTSIAVPAHALSPHSHVHHHSLHHIQTLGAPSTELLNQYLGNYFPADVQIKQQDKCARHAKNLGS